MSNFTLLVIIAPLISLPYFDLIAHSDGISMNEPTELGLDYTPIPWKL
jgi:hypothetical protein